MEGEHHGSPLLLVAEHVRLTRVVKPGPGLGGAKRLRIRATRSFELQGCCIECVLRGLKRMESMPSDRRGNRVLPSHLMIRFVGHTSAIGWYDRRDWNELCHVRLLDDNGRVMCKLCI